MKSSAKRALAACAATLVSAFVLTGCAPSQPTFTVKDLKQVIEVSNTPAGYAVAKQTSSKGTSDKYQQFTNLYKAGSISPAACVDLGAVEGLASAADFKSGVNDKIYDIARYASEAATNRYEFFGVQGRIFSNADAASRFLSAVRKVANECVRGYTTQATNTGSNSSPALNVDSVAVTNLSGTSGVKGLALIENSADSTNDPSYRVAYVQRGNAVLAISTGIKPGGDINFEPSNELVASIAKQLSEAE